MKQIGRLLRYMRPYSLYVLASTLLMAAVGALQAFRILLIKPILDNVWSASASPDEVLRFTVPRTSVTVNLQHVIPRHFHNAWTVVAVALVASAMVKSLCDYVGTLLANKAGFGMITDLRNDLYDSVLRRSMAFFQKHTTGTLLSTLINDIERVQAAMSTVMSDFLQQLFTLIFMIGAVVLVGGKMAWLLLIFVPVIISSARRIGRNVRRTTRRGQDKLAEIQNILHETITGNGIVKAFGMELWEMNRFRGAAARLLSANMRSVAVQSISSPLMDALGAVAIAVLLYIGRQRILHGDSAGAFLTFLVAVMALYDPVRKLPMFYNSFQQAVGASEEIFRFMDEQDDVRERRRATALKGFNDRIVFRDVAFGYGEQGERHEGTARAVLNGISLEVRRGEVLALVGPSGAGKSSLVNLIPRFFDVTAGSITLDGHDLRDVTIESLRRQIGKVTQETVLFNDTVRNNIAYGQPDVPFKRVEDAARMALAHDFIQRMPQGYDTVIGERGARLSGGERQRLAIARAILKNAPILILDEATSALDSESEAYVQTALANLMEGRTSFVIAHRLSTVRRATRIVVMESGEITETGTHEELLERGGTYARLYALQFDGGAGAAPNDAVEEPTLEGVS